MPVPLLSRMAPPFGVAGSNRLAASCTPSRAGSIRSMRALSDQPGRATNAREGARAEWHSARRQLLQEPTAQRADRRQAALARPAGEPDLAARRHARPDTHQGSGFDLALDQGV